MNYFRLQACLALSIVFHVVFGSSSLRGLTRRVVGPPKPHRLGKFQVRLNVLFSNHHPLFQADADMHDIPNEVLGEIFLHLMNLSVPESIFSTPKDLLSEPDIENSITSVRSFQSLLTSTCRQWRTCSISDSRLWTTLAFIAPDYVISTEIGRKLAWEVMEQEISRSCQRRVTILCNLTNDTHMQTAATFLEHILELAAARGEVVWLNLALPVAELVGKEPVGGSIRHLRIRTDPPVFPFQKVKWVPRFVANNSRTLTELHAPSNLVVDAPITRGHMTQMQTLHFEDSISSSVLFNHGTELRSLYLLELTHNSDIPRIRPILPVLTHLRFYSTRGHYHFSTVLDILTLPSLRSIELRSFEPWPMQPSIDSFHRSQCHLTRLVVHGLITGMIIDVLKIFDRTLVELRVVMLDSKERDVMIGILFDYIVNSTITTLPSLQRLLLQTNSEQIPACERMLLTRLVNWREKGVARLVQCLLFVMDGEAKGDWTSIHAFEDPEYGLYTILHFSKS